MTPSCSYHSSPRSSIKIFLACKPLLVPSLTGWLQTTSASTVLKPNFWYLVSNPDWTKFTIQHLPSVMVLQSVPHPQLAILISSLMPISTFLIRFHSYTQSTITQLTRLQHIQNSLAHAVVAAPRSSDSDQILNSLHWLKVQERIEYKIISTTYTQYSWCWFALWKTG